MYIKTLIVALTILIGNVVSANKVLGQIEKVNDHQSKFNSASDISQTEKQDLIKIRKIEITGNTVFSDRDLEKLVSPLEGKKVNRPLPRAFI